MCLTNGAAPGIIKPHIKGSSSRHARNIPGRAAACELCHFVVTRLSCGFPNGEGRREVFFLALRVGVLMLVFCVFISSMQAG